jgi:signal transduction histidine kinase
VIRILKKLNDFFMKHVKLNGVFIYLFITSLAVLLVYFYLPILLNYGAGTINTEFDKDVSSGIAYWAQFIIFGILFLAVETIVFGFALKDFNHYKTLYNMSENSSEFKERFDTVKRKCLTIPLKAFLLITFSPTLILSTIFILLGFTSFADFKIIIVVFTFSTLTASISYILSRYLFSNVLRAVNNTEIYLKNRIPLKVKLIFQLLPIIFVCILFTYLFSYSRYMQDKGDILQKHYFNEIGHIVTNIMPKDSINLMTELAKVPLLSNKDCPFVINPDGDFIPLGNSKFSSFFEKYAKELAHNYNNRVYDYYGTDSQGVIYNIDINGESWIAGIKYDVSNPYTSVILFNILFLILLSIFIVYYFSSVLSSEISTVVNSMTDIVDNKNISLEEKLVVTSNDEIGELVIAFNKIQDLTKHNIEEIKSNEQTLMEKERLASLGQLIGGIAHNMKSPIMSISGAAEGLTELVTEYIASIGNSDVKPEDHKEIAVDMLSWITKIKTHASYMSDIISTVKGQATNLNTTEYDTFSIYDLVKKVDILIKHELKRASISLNIDMQVDPGLTLNGDINSLIQVINNLITNAIQSYNSVPGGTIELTICKEDQNIQFKIKDYGCGMPKEIQEKLFKEMITTKGKLGSGLGLYLSYSTIRGNFGGTITFTSEIGAGTTFIITIPIR